MFAIVPDKTKALVPEPVTVTLPAVVPVNVPLAGGTLRVTVMMSPASAFASEMLKPVKGRLMSSVPL